MKYKWQEICIRFVSYRSFTDAISFGDIYWACSLLKSYLKSIFSVQDAALLKTGVKTYPATDCTLPKNIWILPKKILFHQSLRKKFYFSIVLFLSSTFRKYNEYWKKVDFKTIQSRKGEVRQCHKVCSISQRITINSPTNLYFLVLWRKNSRFSKLLLLKVSHSLLYSLITT